MTVTFKELPSGAFYATVDGRTLQIPLTAEQKAEVERTISLQPQEWDGKANPCKRASCAGRNIICHATCPAYLAYRAAMNEINAQKLMSREANYVTMKAVNEKRVSARRIKRDAKITKSV